MLRAKRETRGHNTRAGASGVVACVILDASGGDFYALALGYGPRSHLDVDTERVESHSALCVPISWYSVLAFCRGRGLPRVRVARWTVYSYARTYKQLVSVAWYNM